MPLQIVRDDITRVKADAIVNATNEELLPGGLCVDTAIHKAAGPGLAVELAQIGYCPTGGVVVTGAYGISQCRHIIHAVPPIFSDGKHRERLLLEECYRKALETAEEYSCESIAFPLLASGANGYPRPEAYAIATSVIREFFISNDSELMVYLVLFGKDAIGISRRAGDNAELNIDDGYVTMKRLALLDAVRSRRGGRAGEFYDERPTSARYSIQDEAPSLLKGRGRGRIRRPSREERKAVLYENSMAFTGAEMCRESLETCRPEDDFRAQDLSFGDMCEWWMVKKGMGKGEFYSHANLGRATFSNIRNHPGSIPKVTSALACAVALKLSIEQTEDLLKRAGIAITPYNPIMKLVIPFIEEKIYDIDVINDALYENDLALLGTNA